MGPTDDGRWARLRPGLQWRRPGIPTAWTRVLVRNPGAMNPEPLPGYVWLETPDKVLHVDEHLLEFTAENPERATDA